MDKPHTGVYPQPCNPTVSPLSGPGNHTAYIVLTRQKTRRESNAMPGILKRIMNIYPYWQAIKWLTIIAIVLPGTVCNSGHTGRALQTPPVCTGWTTIASPFDSGTVSTACAAFTRPSTQVMTS